MTAVQILFIVIAAATLGSALGVVMARNLVHSALWLVGALFGVAVFFGLLNAGFLAVVQVVVYIGAIAILMIFGIMLTRNVAAPEAKRFNANAGWAAFISVVIFGLVTWMLASWPGIDAQAQQLSERADPLKQLGVALVSPSAYVLPFEVASILLLAALIGSIAIAWERK